MFLNLYVELIIIMSILKVYVLFQVIALICGILVVVLMALGLGSADWLMAAGWRQGLFAHCIEPDAPTPLPFNLIEQPGCYRSRDVGMCTSSH